MYQIHKISKKYRLKVIEDSADTITKTDVTDVATTSFYASHVITAGGVGGNSNSGEAFTAKVSGMGFTVGAGTEEMNQASTATGAQKTKRATGYATYSNGPVTIGYQEFYNDNGFASAGTASPDTEGDGFGIAISQDNYSISYSEVTEQTKADGATAALKEVEMSAIQGTYTMGAMTLGISMYETDNPEGATGKYEETELSVSFAF